MANNTIITYQDGSVSSYSIIGEITYNSIANKSNIIFAEIGSDVSSLGNSAFSGCSKISTIIVPDYVEIIGPYAFSGCNNLTNVVISNGVKTIGQNAFDSCSSLSSIAIPSSVTNIGVQAFGGCSNISSFIVDENNPNYSSFSNLLLSKDRSQLVAGINGNVVIPDCVTDIRLYAFYNYSNLSSIIIPDSVVTIGQNAFTSCDKLSSVIIPDSVISLGKRAFFGCYNLKNASIGNNVPKIEDDTFYMCRNLTNISIGNKVTSIGSAVFYECNNLTTISIPSSVVAIGQNAFYNCNNLTNISIPSSVVNIEINAFDGCFSNYSINNKVLFKGRTLDSVEAMTNYPWRIPEGIIYADILIDGKVLYKKNDHYSQWIKIDATTDYNGTFNRFDDPDYQHICEIIIPNNDISGKSIVSFGDNIFSEYSQLTSITIPNSVSSIGNSAFYKCSLKELYLPNGIFSIGDYAFQHNSNLESITIPNSVVNVGQYAFAECSQLSAINISNKLSSIEDGLFYSCLSVASISIPNSVETIGDYAFYNCENLRRLAIGNHVTSIGQHAFTNGIFSSLAFPASIAYIDVSAFNNCCSVINVSIPQYICENSLSSILPDSYQNIKYATVLNSVSTISATAFSDCSSLQRLSIASGSLQIENRAFASNEKLNSVTFTALSSQQVKRITNYPWDLQFGTMIHCLDISFPVKRQTTIVTYSDATTEELNITGYIDLSKVKKLNLDVVKLDIGDAVTSIAKDAFIDCSTLQSVVFQSSIRSIASNAFSGCTNLQVFNMPEDVRTIGSSAFMKCTSLRSISIPSSVVYIESNAFNGCTNLQDFDMQEGVLEIESGAFMKCTSLRSISIPSSVVYIRSNAFSGCLKLLEVYFLGKTKDQVQAMKSFSWSLKNNTSAVCTDGVLTIYNGNTLVKYEGSDEWTEVQISGELNAYSIPSKQTATDIILGNDVSSIGNACLYGSSVLSGLYIPSTVVSIGNQAFQNCSALKNVNIPDSVSSIGEYAFAYSGIASMSLPGYLSIVNKYTFKDCSNLAIVIVPDSCLCIDNYAFFGCSSLTDIQLGSSVSSIGASTFANCYSLSTMTIPSSVVSIGVTTFADCNQLLDVTFKEKTITDVKSMENFSWALKLGTILHCSDTDYKLTHRNTLVKWVGDTTWTEIDIQGLLNGSEISDHNTLESIDIGSDVSSIGAQAFYNCASLANVIISYDVVSIGRNAFCGCSSLSSVTIGNGISRIDDNAFLCCSNLSSLSIPNSVSSIGQHTFDNCNDQLYNYIEFNNIRVNLVDGWATSCNIYQIDNEVCTTLNLDFKGICDAAFMNLNSLIQVCSTKSSSVKHIPVSAFLGCVNLYNLQLSNMYTIGDYAFASCACSSNNYDSYVNIYGGLSSIGKHAFDGCRYMSSFDIYHDNNLTSIQEAAFKNCQNLHSVDIETCYVTEIGKEAFAGCIYLNKIPLCVSISNIGEYAFVSCFQDSQLFDMSNLSNITQINEGVFKDCKYLSSIVLPSSLTDIGDYAFQGCSYLSNINIPSSISHIGMSAFADCSQLTNFYFHSDTPPAVGTSAFSNVAVSAKAWVDGI